MQQTSCMTKQTVKSIMALGALVSACMFVSIPGAPEASSSDPTQLKGQTPDGTVDMREVQAAYMGSGTAGNGVLFFRGTQYPFEVGGVRGRWHGPLHHRCEGRGVQPREALEQFPGTYGQARYGFAIGTASAGDLWMQNEAGVIMHLKAKREGLMLSLGGDAVVIKMGQ